MAFENVLTALKSLGFYDFLLPWLFVFAVVYGLLNILKVFGDSKRISTAIALVVAFFVTGYSGQALSTFFINLFGGASMIIAGILVVLLFLAMVGYTPADLQKGKKAAVLIVLVIIGVVLWLLSTGAAQGFGMTMLLSPDVIAMILVLVVIIMAVWAIVSEKEPAAPAGGKPS